MIHAGGGNVGLATKHSCTVGTASIHAWRVPPQSNSSVTSPVTATDASYMHVESVNICISAGTVNVGGLGH